jgi:hypothetical protein
MDKRFFSFLLNVQTDNEAHTASYPVDTEDYFRGIKAAGT